MRKTVFLPMVKETPIVSFNFHAAYLSVLFTIKDYYKYFYSDFVNIWLTNDKKCTAGFVMEKWYCSDEFFDLFILKSNKDEKIVNHMGENLDTELSKLIRKDNLIKNIKTMLDAGFYVSGRINEFYVPQRNAENKYDRKHDFYLNGYNDIKEIFYLNGYTLEGYYKTVEIPYTKFLQGLDSLKGCYNILSFYKIKDNYDFQIDLGKIILQLNDYIDEKMSFANPSGVFKDEEYEIYYGKGVYRELINSIKDRENIDLRIFRILLENKRCMLTRIKMLEEIGLFVDKTIFAEYVGIVKEHKFLFNMAIKYKIGKERELLDRIIQRLKYIDEHEISVLIKLLECIYKFEKERK